MTMVLKLDDKVKIEGESILKGYEKQIDVTYLDHGMSMPMVGDKSSNSRTSGRCAHKDVRCTMRLNKSYPKLLEACAKGTNMGNTTLVMTKVSEGKVEVVAKIEMSDVFVSAVNLIPAHSDEGRQLAAASIGPNGLPWFSVDLSYQSIAVTYNEYDSTGASKGAVSCEALTGLGA